MLTFVVRRLLFAVPVLLGVVFVVMLTIDLLPGDAVTLMLGEHATKEAVARLREHLGLDKPFAVRYVDYVGRVAQLALRRAGAAGLALRTLDADLLDRAGAHRRVLAMAQLAAGRRRRLAVPSGPAGGHAGAAQCRDAGPHDALGGAGRAA